MFEHVTLRRRRRFSQSNGLAGMNLNPSSHVPGHAWFMVDDVAVCLPVDEHFCPIPGVYGPPVGRP